MAKRFTDTEKWRDTWFRKLDPFYKLLWIYFLDICNHAGILEIDPEMAEFSIGCEEQDWTDILDTFSKRVVSLGGEKFFIPKFIDFQYGTLNPDNRTHFSVINILKKYGAFKHLGSPLQGCKDKGTDKDKDKGKDKDKDKGTGKKKKPEICWPEGFSLTDKMREYAIKKGVVDPGAEFEDFHNWATSKDRVYVDWEAGWRTRCTKYKEYNQSQIKRGPERNVII